MYRWKGSSPVLRGVLKFPRHLSTGWPQPWRAWWPLGALWMKKLASVWWETIWKEIEAHIRPITFPCGAESQQAKICCGSAVSSKMVSVVFLALVCWFISFKSSSREAAERDSAWPIFLTSWENIFIPGWSGSMPLDSDHSASQHKRPWLAPLSWWRWASVGRKREGVGMRRTWDEGDGSIDIWHQRYLGWGRWLYLWCLRLLKSLECYIPSFILSVAQTLFSLFFFFFFQKSQLPLSGLNTW